MLQTPIKQLNKRAFFIVAAVVFAALALHASPAHAENGITVTPAIVTISIGAADTQKSETINIHNGFSSSVSLALSLASVDQANGILVPSGSLDEHLAKVLFVSDQTMTLAAGESKQVTITAVNGPDLKPGGSYATLVVKQLEQSKNTVGLQSAVSTGIFLIKEDGAIRSLTLDSVKISRILFEQPKTVTLQFTNNGNVQIVPRGQVVVASSNLQQIYKRGIINQESIMILPDKSLRINVPLITTANSWIPTKHQLIVQYRYDGSEEIKTYKQSFLYIPFYVFILLILLIIMAYYGVKNVRKRKKRPIPSIVKSQPMPPTKRIIVHDKTDGEKITVNRGK